jgi:hypothetical protein
MDPDEYRIDEEIAEMRVKLLILQALQPFEMDRRARIVQAVFHIIEAQRLIPGLQVILPELTRE